MNSYNVRIPIVGSTHITIRAESLGEAKEKVKFDCVKKFSISELEEDMELEFMIDNAEVVEE